MDVLKPYTHLYVLCVRIRVTEQAGKHVCVFETLPGPSAHVWQHPVSLHNRQDEIVSKYEPLNVLLHHPATPPVL